MLAHHANNVPGQSLQPASAQIFFAELDVVHTSQRSFGHLGQQRPAASVFVATELATVGKVIEETAGSHQLPAYCGGVVNNCKFSAFQRIAAKMRFRPLGWSKKITSSIGPGFILRYSPRWIAACAKPSGCRLVFSPYISASYSCERMKVLNTGVATNPKMVTRSTTSGRTAVSPTPRICHFSPQRPSAHSS